MVETGKAKHRHEVDLEQVGKLVQELERDLETISSDSAAVQRLKDEVQTLKNVLGSPVRRHHWIRDGLQSIRDVFESARDTAVVDGLRGGQYLAEIGRILGL